MCCSSYRLSPERAGGCLKAQQLDVKIQLRLTNAKALGKYSFCHITSLFMKFFSLARSESSCLPTLDPTRAHGWKKRGEKSFFLWFTKLSVDGKSQRWAKSELNAAPQHKTFSSCRESTEGFEGKKCCKHLDWLNYLNANASSGKALMTLLLITNFCRCHVTEKNSNRSVKS